MTTTEEIGSLLSRIAAADKGFLVLVLTAASKAACDLSPAERAMLAEWGKEVAGAEFGAPGDDSRTEQKRRS